MWWNRFRVNFQCDRDGDNIGLHFNPRQDQGDVVLNARLGGDWGEEERGLDDSPFERGDFFEVFFIAVEDKFNVSVRCHHFVCSVHWLAFLCHLFHCG